MTKMGKGKFVASVENKTLRQYTTREEVQGTAPVQGDGKPPETVATYQPTAADGPAVKAVPAEPIVSPLDEMNKQLPETDTDKQKVKAKAGSKKPVKVAKNK